MVNTEAIIEAGGILPEIGMFFVKNWQKSLQKEGGRVVEMEAHEIYGNYIYRKGLFWKIGKEEEAEKSHLNL